MSVQNSVPIKEAVDAHNALGRSSFHMPAHKGRADFYDEIADWLLSDITELPDTPDVLGENGAVAAAQELAAQTFGCKKSIMSAGGCSLAVAAMIRLAAPGGGKLLCSRVIHRSAVNAMSLLGVEPVWLLPDGSAGADFAGRVSVEDAARAIEKNPDVRAIYLTSPDYFGVMSDIEALAALGARHDIPVIVDNAHGAHLYFLKNVKAPLQAGAAMSADSAHKTLGSLTGGAWLNINDDRFLASARDAFELFGSTSPLSLISCSLDMCRRRLAISGEADFEALAVRILEIKKELASLGFLLPEGECDPLRIAFSGANLVGGGDKAGEILRENGVEPEYAGGNGVILIPSPYNTDEDFQRLLSAIKRLSEFLTDARVEPLWETLPQKSMSLREAMLREAQAIDVRFALGRTAALPECHCPPAVPLIMPGEIIGEAEISKFISQRIFQIKVVK